MAAESEVGDSATVAVRNNDCADVGVEVTIVVRLAGVVAVAAAWVGDSWMEGLHATSSPRQSGIN